MKRGIFIGRFQPFQLGHLCVVEQMEGAEDLDELIIGIGTSQVGHTAYNPFTSQEREEMIRRSLGDVEKPYHLVEIPDINDFPRWIPHVESLTPKFHVVYVGEDSITAKLFREADYEVRVFDRSVDPSGRVSGTEIRQLMATGGNWKDYVPQGAAEFISEIKGAERVRELYGRFMNPSVTTDIVIDYKDQGIALIERKNEPFKGFWALPGGFLDAAKESARTGAAREAREETGLNIQSEDLTLLGVYSDPGRDPRGPTVSIAYYVKVAEGELRAGDDASKAKPFKQIPSQLAFDHHKILRDYFKVAKGK